MRSTSTFSQPKKFKKKMVKEASCDHDFSASVGPGVNLKVIARISNVHCISHRRTPNCSDMFGDSSGKF